MTVFHAHCDGFFITTADKAELQAWIDARKLDSKGKLLKLTQGVRTGDCDRFGGGLPTREAVL